MPHFHFTVYVTLAKMGEQPVVMTKQVMDFYMSIIMDVAYSMARSYLESGWRIERVDCRDFIFYTDISHTWED